MGFTLANYRTELRLDLKDSGALWSDGELDRCVERALSDLNRFMPLEAVYEMTIDYEVTDEAWVSDSSAGTYVSLGNKPIKPNSETVKDDASATMVRDTDYTIDYANGAITHISGGDIGNGESCTITYTKSRLGIDISSVISNLIRVVRVEYPVNKIPQQFVSYNIWNDFMYIGSQKPGSSQTQMIDKEHIAIYYDKEHTAPTASAAGTNPAFLDQVLCIGAGAYALSIKALQYDHQAVTDLASLRTTIGNIAGVHTLSNAALGKVTTYVADMDTALDAAITEGVASATALGKINSDSGRVYLTDADAAYDLAAAESALGNAALDKINTYLAGGSESTKKLLAQITTDIAELRTKIITDLDDANTAIDSLDMTNASTYLGNVSTALGKVNVYLVTNTNEDSKFWLTKITTDISDLRTAIVTAADAANSYLDEVDTTDLGQATVGAEGYLETGDDLINKSNKGVNVPENYADYSKTRAVHGQTRANAALGFLQEVNQRLSNLRSYIEQADGWGKIAARFIDEASVGVALSREAILRERAKVEQGMALISQANARMAYLRVYIEQAAAYGIISDGFATEARERTAISQARINEARGRAEIADRWLAEAATRNTTMAGYIGEANGRRGMTQAFVEEATGRVAEISAYLGEADRYSAAANTNLLLSDRFKEESVARRNEFWSILKDKSEYRKRIASTPVTQPA